MIKAEHLSKKFKNKRAVDDVSFNVETGYVTGFLGPNGAGKSTTMRLMLGLDNGQGSVTYDGKPLDSYTEPSQVVGMLLEAKAFHPSRTARNHLRVLADAGNISHSRIDKVLNVVGLSDVADKRPGTFSLGMSQRLGIAAAILGEPKYLVLDEPANGLDPEGTRWLRNFLKDYAAKGNAVFVSSHLLGEMSVLADQIVVIGKGKLLANMSTEELLASGKRSSVFVRAKQPAKLERELKRAKLQYSREGKYLTVTGTTTDAVGKLAHKAGVELHELTARSDSLEEVFLSITSGAQEYSAKSEAEEGEAS